MSGGKTSWLSFVTAVHFLTIIPIPVSWPKDQKNSLIQARSILFYPLVGGLIGLFLFVAYYLTTVFSDMLGAVVVLTTWVIVTGALHLDGLADSADAWLGGYGNRQKTLTILQDTHSGVAAIVAVVLLLLLKLSMLVELNENLMIALFLSPILARAAVTGLLATTPYVRENGIASAMMASLPVKSIWVLLLCITAAMTVWFGMSGILIVLSLVIFVFLFRFMIKSRIGGTTGDTAGALVELLEVLVLFDFILIDQFL